MLFADSEPTGNTWGYVVAGLIGALPGLATAYVAISNARSLANSKKRTDALDEWKQTASDLRNQLASERVERATTEASIRAEYGDKIKTLQTDIRVIADRERECAINYAKREVEFQSALAQIRRLQEAVNDSPPGVTVPVEIIAGADGKIYWASAAVGPMFHHLPTDLPGKSIEILIPERLREAQRKGMAKLIASGRDPDPDRSVLTVGVTRQGVEFPIRINLSAWRGQAGKYYLSAEIRRQLDGDIQSSRPPVPTAPPEAHP